jgi:hypothetical protein
VEINLLQPKGEILTSVAYYSEYYGARQWPCDVEVFWDTLNQKEVKKPRKHEKDNNRIH